MQLILAKPRGVCAGVARAVEIVERALERFGTPLYVRREIVHNSYTVQRLREQGVVFVEELHEVPRGATVVFSAHGVSPAVKAEAGARGLHAIDATCPLVTKVHREVLRYADKGCQLILIGHQGHDEVLGTMGHAPGSVTLVQNVQDAKSVNLPAGMLVVLTQTTLSVDDTREIMAALRQRFPHLATPKATDVCFATQNRQDAVKALCDASVDLLLVVGSENSSNSQRLVEVAERRGIEAHLVDNAEDVDTAWLKGKARVGLSAGASSPEVLVEKLVQRLEALGVQSVETLETMREDVVFALPRELREEDVTAR
ncbi:MAG: 4-hydroxy-3-methylbut-2-enyl diphosphate reductase [Deltaproteobacteria bacterium]|nr:4-hydroxy-3-methylbut-2-enyl diphosphate reductase [Deltaproteobacteria bacterium]